MTLTLEINAQSVQASPGLTIFDHAEPLGIRIPTSCFKQGKCGECLVQVTRGMECLSPKSEQERHLQEQFRLSCRAQVVAGAAERIECHTLRRNSMRVEESGSGVFVNHVPDPAVVRDGEWVVLDGDPIAKSTGPLYGVAVDLGTTTVVMRLVDLETGAVAAAQSFENPQRFGGSDIMARIRYDTEHRGRLLQRTLLGYMVHALEDFPCDHDDIYEMVIVGNTTMRDLFFGLDVHSIGQKPYRSITESELRDGKRKSTHLVAPATKFRLPMHPRARVYSLPLLGGHVGSDAAACLLAIDMAHEERTVAIMDVGTNTELLVGHRGKIFVASCPAGPAFEGGGVSCGMPALEGAIERVHLGNDGSVEMVVIGGKTPEGLCGSGLIDVVGELRRTDRMNSLGRLADGHASFSLEKEHGLSIWEEDISQLAQAKAANMAGLQIVLERFGIDVHELDMFYLAGGFARHIDVAAAKRIGLIPNLPDEKIVKVGNAAIEGATLALLSVSKRRELEEGAPAVNHVELETHPRFFDYFVEACQFAPLESHCLRGDG